MDITLRYWDKGNLPEVRGCWRETCVGIRDNLKVSELCEELGVPVIFEQEDSGKRRILMLEPPEILRNCGKYVLPYRVGVDYAGEIERLKQ